MVAEDIFLTLSNNNGKGCSLENTTCSIAIFEIYGGRIQDLLNKRNRLKVLEDGKGEVVVSGLEEFEASNPRDFLGLIEQGHNNRTTHATEANDVSSRSRKSNIGELFFVIICYLLKVLWSELTAVWMVIHIPSSYVCE